MGASDRIADQPTGQPFRIDDCYEEYAISEADAEALRNTPTWAELSAIALPGAFDDVE